MDPLLSSAVRVLNYLSLFAINCHFANSAAPFFPKDGDPCCWSTRGPEGSTMLASKSDFNTLLMAYFLHYSAVTP
jgi:hypothetical protein